MKKLTKMQVDEVLDKANAYIKAHPKIRKGQAFFNILHGMYPSYANTIRATKYDPFYVDDKLDVCISYLTKEEGINPLLKDVDKILEVGISAFWLSVVKYIDKEHPTTTEEQHSETYKEIVKTLKKML